MDLTCIVFSSSSPAVLQRCLQSVSWAKEVVLIDCTRLPEVSDLAQGVRASVHGVAGAEQARRVGLLCLKAARCEWVLLVAGNEHLADDAESLLEALAEQHGREHAVIALPRFHYLAGQVLRSDPFYPDFHARWGRRSKLVWETAWHALSSEEENAGAFRPPVDQAPHLHCEPYASLADVADAMWCRVHRTTQDAPHGEFEFRDHLRRALEQYASRDNADDKDGDVTIALSLIEAWSELVRGVILWDQHGRPGSLEDAFALPLTTVARDPGLAESVQRLVGELETMNRNAQVTEKDLAQMRDYLQDRSLVQRLRRFLGHPPPESSG